MAGTAELSVRPSHPADVASWLAAARDVLTIDWHAVRRADRACCCPAIPVVVAVLPPAADRAHDTEVLLCGHHYRICRSALAAAHALVVDMAGAPLADYEWPEVPRVRSAG